jgi:hypothetical protein
LISKAFIQALSDENAGIQMSILSGPDHSHADHRLTRFEVGPIIQPILRSDTKEDVLHGSL